MPEGCKGECSRAQPKFLPHRAVFGLSSTLANRIILSGRGGRVVRVRSSYPGGGDSAANAEGLMMAIGKQLKMYFFLVLASLTLAGSAPGQLATPGQSPLEAVSGGAVRNLSPGNMVSAGVGAALAFGDIARGGVRITETSRPTSIRAQALADSIQTVFNQFNLLLVFLEDLLLARADLSPTGQPDSPAANGGDGSSDGSGQGRRKPVVPIFKRTH